MKFGTAELFPYADYRPSVLAIVQRAKNQLYAGLSAKGFEENQAEWTGDYVEKVPQTQDIGR